MSQIGTKLNYIDPNNATLNTYSALENLLEDKDPIKENINKTQNDSVECNEREKKFGPDWLYKKKVDKIESEPSIIQKIHEVESKGRYSKEEILNLYRPDCPIPSGFEFFEVITSHEPLPPVTLQPQIDEDNLTTNVSNYFGRGQQTVRGRSRGRGRGRGRGRIAWDDNTEEKERPVNSGRGRGRGKPSEEKPWRKQSGDNFFDDFNNVCEEEEEDSEYIPEWALPENQVSNSDSSSILKRSTNTLESSTNETKTPPEEVPPREEDVKPKSPLPQSETTIVDSTTDTKDTSSFTTPQKYLSKSQPNIPSPSLRSPKSSFPQSPLVSPLDNPSQPMANQSLLQYLQQFHAGSHPQQPQPQPQPQQPQQQPQQPQEGQQGPTQISDNWFYKDPSGVSHGPYPSIQMEKWLKHHSNAFKLDLLVRRENETKFVPLVAIFLREHRNPFSNVPLMQWLLQPPMTEFKASLWQVVQNQQRQEQFILYQRQQQQLQQILSQAKESTGQVSQGPIFGPKQSVKNSQPPHNVSLIPPSPTQNPISPHPPTSPVNPPNIISSSSNPLMSQPSLPPQDPIQKLMSGQPYNWNAAWLQQQQFQKLFNQQTRSPQPAQTSQPSNSSDDSLTKISGVFHLDMDSGIPKQAEQSELHLPHLDQRQMFQPHVQKSPKFGAWGTQSDFPIQDTVHSRNNDDLSQDILWKNFQQNTAGISPLWGNFDLPFPKTAKSEPDMKKKIVQAQHQKFRPNTTSTETIFPKILKESDIIPHVRPPEEVRLEGEWNSDISGTAHDIPKIDKKGTQNLQKSQGRLRSIPPIGHKTTSPEIYKYNSETEQLSKFQDIEQLETEEKSKNPTSAWGTIPKAVESISLYDIQKEEEMKKKIAINNNEGINSFLREKSMEKIRDEEKRPVQTRNSKNVDTLRKSNPGENSAQKNRKKNTEIKKEQSTQNKSSPIPSDKKIRKT